MDVGIIGARGFVGGYLLAYLQARGASVTGYAREVIDLANPKSFSALGEHDVLINCAAQVSSPVSELFDVNVQALHSLCAQLNHRAKKPFLLQVSSGSVYGYVDHAVDVHSPAAPQGAYAMTKFLGDEVIRLSYRGPWAIARLYFPYGEGQSVERLIPRLIRRVLAGETIEVSRHGSYPLINPMYISDVCEQLYSLMAGEVAGIKLLGGAQVVSVADIALMIGRIACVDVKFCEVEGATSNMFCEGEGRVLLDQGLVRLIPSLC